MYEAEFLVDSEKVSDPSLISSALVGAFVPIPTNPFPPLGARIISPVVFPPIVKVLFAVVWMERGAPASVKLPENDAFEVVVRFVKLPVDGVVTPIAVPLIPVEVVLKLFDVIVKSFEPVSIDDAPRPESARLPDVAVTLNAPDPCVKPVMF